ncbi:MAG: nucleotidyltransferase domain-containing protein [Anaerolineaceae bacterium]
MTTILSTDPVIERIVKKILTVGKPDQIILFGSRARGQTRSDSDYDLLIVEDSSQPRYRRSAPYRRALKEMDFPKDILVWTPGEIKEWENVSHAFITTVIREGRILYER